MSAVTRALRSIGLIAALLSVASPAFAQKSWQGAMKGTNENPPNASTATGYSYVTLNGNFLTVTEFFNGLIGGNAAAAHIHCCVAPGNNIGVAVGFPGFPAATSGAYNHIFDLTDPNVYTAAFRNGFGGGTAAGAEAALIAGLDAGNAYANIHNQVYPGGEIRANLVASPEPASMALVATGLVTFAGVGWRRRRHA